MSHATANVSAKEALLRLAAGNSAYLAAATGTGDVSYAKRQDTCANGQHPYAIVLTCSDSRVIPEAIFSAGIGELFVIRVAGNVVDDHVLGSIAYAAEHLGCRLVLVLGHSHCGAVGAAIAGGADGPIATITAKIKRAIKEETDDDRACVLNVEYVMAEIEAGLGLCGEGLQVAGGVYRIEDGRVELL